MTDCIIKAFGGCACKPGECAEKPATPAPVISFSWRDQLAAVAVGVAVAISVYFAMSAWNEQLGKDAKTEQEVTRHVAR